MKILLDQEQQHRCIAKNKKQWVKEYIAAWR